MKAPTLGMPSYRANETMTQKQYAIMTVICQGDGKDGEGKFVAIDIDQLLERIPYKTTKDSMHFSLRALMRRGLLKKGDIRPRNGRHRRTLVATDLGRALILQQEKSEHFVEPTEPDEIIESLNFGIESKGL